MGHDSPDPLEAKDRTVPLTRLVAVCDADGDVVEDVVVYLGAALTVNEALRAGFAAAVVVAEAEEEVERPALRKTRAGGN